jgi:cytidylate kinase
MHDSRFETHELRILQAHLLHYQSLLHNFKISVTFIEETPNPAMESEVFTQEQRVTSKELMKKECKNLLSQIDLLERRREMLTNRLKNVLDLAFEIVNTEGSRQTRILTEATIRDSATMVPPFPTQNRRIRC